MDQEDLDRLREEASRATEAMEKVADQGVEWTQTMLLLSSGIFLFGLVVLLLMTWLLLRSDREPVSILRTFCVPLIIVAALVLVVAGYTQDQIAPVIGLLGTIAGYLLGRSDRNDPNSGVRNQDESPIRASEQQVARNPAAQNDELPS